MEESLTGFICRGGWMDIVEHGEKITAALRTIGADDDYDSAFTRWDSWRPKAVERLRTDVNQKTAEQASTSEGAGEKAGNGPDDDLREAGKKFTESVESIEQGKTKDAFDNWRESVGYTARAADSSWRRTIRRIEQFIYKHLMTAVSPYYFDTELVQANIQRTSRNESTYRFEVNIPDDELRDEVRSQLELYASEVERWHHEVPKDVEQARYTDGIDDTVEAETEGVSVKTVDDVCQEDH